MCKPFLIATSKPYNPSVKVIQATRLNFELDFELLLQRARDGTMARQQWASAVRAIIRRYGRQAFIDGLIDGGILDGALSFEDEQRIQELIKEQSQYVTNFGEQLYKAITDREALRKPAMWFNKSIFPFYDAGKLSADKNSYYEWQIGFTEDHCSDCLRLNHQIHRLRDWHKSGWLPQADKLECKGFNCDCKLLKRTGVRARGRLSRRK